MLSSRRAVYAEGMIAPSRFCLSRRFVFKFDVRFKFMVGVRRSNVAPALELPAEPEHEPSSENQEA